MVNNKKRILILLLKRFEYAKEHQDLTPIGCYAELVMEIKLVVLINLQVNVSKALV